MKWLISFFICIHFFSTSDLNTTRELYSKVSASDKNTDEFINHVARFKTTSNTSLKAYYAASLFLIAKNKKKLKEKKEYLKQGKTILEDLIDENHNNIEFRFIRLSIQENLPKIVQYNNKDEDKKFILNHLKNTDIELKDYIKGFILQSKSFNKSEKNQL